MNYQDILKQKENNITRIDEIIKFLRENFDGLDKYDSKYSQLIVLLNKEKRLYSNLDKSNPDVFYNELRDIKRQIGFKISEIKYELSKALKEKKSAPKIKEQAIKSSEEKDSGIKKNFREEYDEDIYKKTKEISKRTSEYFEYYLTKSFEERSVKDYFNALLKFHPLILSGISLVGMIYYFAYFGFELKYFPDLGGADVAYVGVSLFFMLATISLFFILPCLCYPGYHKKDIGWIFFFGLSLLPLFTLVCMATLNTIINKSLDVLFWFSLIGSFIYLIIVICTDKFTTFSLCKVAILIIIFPENFSFNGWFFFFNSWTLSYDTCIL